MASLNQRVILFLKPYKLSFQVAYSLLEAALRHLIWGLDGERIQVA